MKTKFRNSALLAAIVFLVSCSEYLNYDYGKESENDLKNIKISTLTEAATAEIGNVGGTITVAATGTAVDGIKIKIPAKAYSSTQTFIISYAEIISHEFGENFKPISPFISVLCDGGYADELISVTVPVTVPEGSVPVGFMYNAETGKLEGMPVKTYSSTSITLVTRHFLPGSSLTPAAGALKLSRVPQAFGANIIISSIPDSLLELNPVITSGFRPGVDDWEFANDGSYLTSSGQGTGQNAAALWYYYEKKPDEGPLFGQFSSNDQLWQDNNLGYRFCSVLQDDLDGNGEISASFEFFIDKLQDLDHYNLLLIAATMLVTGEPQAVAAYHLRGLDERGSSRYTGQVLICYQISMSEGKIFISDPGAPGSDRAIDYSGDNFEPYNSKFSGHSEPVTYPFITYFGKTSLLDWVTIAGRYREVANKTIGTLAPNSFPEYTISLPDLTGQALTDGLVTSRDTLRFAVICPSAEVYFDINGSRQTGMMVFDEYGTRIDEQEGKSNAKINLKSGSYVVLKPGINKLGCYVVGWRNDDKDSRGVFYDQYIDFRWFSVTYQR